MTRAVIDARRAGTVVDVPLTQQTFEPSGTLAAEVIDGVDTASAVQTRRGATVVDVVLTERSLVASRTDAVERVHHVHALATCTQTQLWCRYGIVEFNVPYTRHSIDHFGDGYTDMSITSQTPVCPLSGFH